MKQYIGLIVVAVICVFAVVFVFTMYGGENYTGQSVSLSSNTGCKWPCKTDSELKMELMEQETSQRIHDEINLQEWKNNHEVKK